MQAMVSTWPTPWRSSIRRSSKQHWKAPRSAACGGVNACRTSWNAHGRGFDAASADAASASYNFVIRGLDHRHAGIRLNREPSYHLEGG